MIMERVAEAFGVMILGSGLFQADAHPGNILVLKGAARRAQSPWPGSSPSPMMWGPLWAVAWGMDIVLLDPDSTQGCSLLACRPSPIPCRQFLCQVLKPVRTDLLTC